MNFYELKVFFYKKKVLKPVLNFSPWKNSLSQHDDLLVRLFILNNRSENFLNWFFLSFSKDLASDTWKVKVGGITLYHFSGLVFKFNFSFHKIFLSNIGKWTDFTRNWYLGQNFWTKVKISFLAKISNLLKFFRKSTCSSDKFPDLAFGPSNYLPNISRRQFSFRIVIKHLIKFCPASGSLRLSEARTVSQLSTRWQPNWSRAQQTSSDRYFPTNVPSLFVARLWTGTGKDSRPL